MNPSLGNINKNLIKKLQEDIGNDEKPFLRIAEKLNITEEEVIQQTKKLLEKGIIRRFGAVLRHNQAGMEVNVMSVWKVAESDVERVGNIMAGFSEVSHCYERPVFASWPYNLYAMIHGHNNDECEDVVQRIAKASGISEYKLLCSIKEFKKDSMRYY
ncbi:MAG: Lrp/AsnC family transcriptional regulator [bacterium]